MLLARGRRSAARVGQPSSSGEGWDISTLEFSQSIEIDLNTTGLFFKPDGLKLYLTVAGSSNTVREYSLSTAWDISTASFSQSLSVRLQETVVSTGHFLKPDGTRLFIVGWSDEVNEYALSTAWDIGTASFVRSFAFAEDILSGSLFFRPDGLKMYVRHNSLPNDFLYEYNLSPV